MSNVNISIGLQVTIDEFDVLETALINKYGANFVITYRKTDKNFIFSCPKICNRVIRIYRYSIAYSAFRLFIGTSWVSGDSVVNEKIMFSHDSTPIAIEIILGDDFMLICQPSNNTGSTGINLIGKLSNGVFVGIGAGGGSTFCFGYKFNNDGTDISAKLFCLSEACVNQEGYYYKQPVYVISEYWKLEFNDDGSIATIKDLYNISASIGRHAMIKSSNYILTPSGVGMVTNGVPTLQTSLFAEFS